LAVFVVATEFQARASVPGRPIQIAGTRFLQLFFQVPDTRKPEPVDMPFIYILSNNSPGYLKYSK
jgi:hypothetical protein